jgi:hypothetical protein
MQQIFFRGFIIIIISLLTMNVNSQDKTGNKKPAGHPEYVFNGHITRMNKDSSGRELPLSMTEIELRLAIPTDTTSPIHSGGNGAGKSPGGIYLGKTKTDGNGYFTFVFRDEIAPGLILQISTRDPGITFPGVNYRLPANLTLFTLGEIRAVMQ